MATYRITCKPGGTQVRIDQLRSRGLNTFPNAPLKIKEGAHLDVEMTPEQHDRFFAQYGRVADVTEVPVEAPAAPQEPPKKPRRA